MVNYPIIYQRDFRHDFPSIEKGPNDETWQKCERAALAALPLLSIYRPFRGPLSLGMSGFRSVTHGSAMIEHFRRGAIKEGSFHMLHACLAVAAIGLFFFNPVLCFLLTSISDLILNTRTLIEAARAGKIKESLEAAAFILLDLLFITSFCYGMIEITVVCMMAQILLNLYLSQEHFRKGEYFEGICKVILGGAQVHALVPQAQVLHWKHKYKPELTAELKQDERGFVYLDIPDEQIHTLFPLCNDQKAELPPYFGKGRVGGHVTVIPVDEHKQYGDFKVEDVGKKVSFRIVNVDSVKPDGWKGVDKVYYLTLSSPELESLRTHHGLTPKHQGHDFHITFGIRKEAV